MTTQAKFLKSILLAAVAMAGIGSALPARAGDMGERCDTYAGSPADETLPAGIDGVAFGDIDVAMAAAACRAAWSDGDGAARFAFNLARVLHQDERNEEARGLYETAVARGHMLGKINIGQMMLADAAAAAAALDIAVAETGNMVGLYNAAIDYRDGLGVDVDMVKAVDLFERAAALGYADASYALAALYDDGWLVLADSARAVTYYERAIAASHVDAMVYLAIMYRDAHGIEANPAKAIELFRMAAGMGNATAVLQLAIMLQDGSDADAAEAIEHLRAALAARDLELASYLIRFPDQVNAAGRSAIEQELIAAGLLDGVADGVFDAAALAALRAHYAAPASL